jgi:hypothetical protein
MINFNIRKPLKITVNDRNTIKIILPAITRDSILNHGISKKQKNSLKIELTGNGSWDCASQSGNGGFSDLFGCWSSSLELHASCAHVRLQQSSFQVDVVVAQSLVDGGEDDLGDLLATFQIVITIGQDFWFNDWNNALRLAD